MENTQQPQIDVNDLITKINENINQRLSPIEERMNQQTPEQLEEVNERKRQLFDSNPTEYENKLLEQAEQRLMAKVAPELQKTQQLNSKLTWQDNIRQYTAQNPEASKYMPQMLETLKSNPSLIGTSNPLDSAYKMAVANNLLSNGGDVVQGILSNEEYKNKILENPDIYNAVVQKYQQGLNSGKPGLPPIMGNSPGGSIPASGGELPRNLKEAKQSALRRFQG